MGQLIIVQGQESPRRDELFRRGVELVESIHGIRAAGRISSKSCAAAVFPMRNGSAAGIARFGAEAWVSGAGTWFYEGRAGSEGLDRLASRLEGPSESEAWLRELDGAFALAISREDELRVVTDPLGTLHIYMQAAGDYLVLGTSSLALAALTRPAWDPVGCREFLATGTVFETRTLFDGIAKLGPASLFTFSGGRLKSQTVYWKLPEVMYDRAPRTGTVPELAESLRESVATIGRNFRRPAVDLTGGFDSRAVLGAAMAGGVAFETVVNGSDDNPDVVAAGRIAREFGLKHHHGKRPPRADQEWSCDVQEALRLCDGEYDATLYAPVFVTHTRLSRDFDVSINGSNGEIAKGYWWELLIPNVGKRGHFDARRVAARRFVAQGEVAGLLAAEFQDDLPDLFAGIIRRANAGLEDHPNTAQMDNVYLRLRMQRWQGRLASATSRIWPTLSPFAFRGPMEAALAAPPAVRANNRMTCRLIEHQSVKLASLPLAEGYPALSWRLSRAHRFWPLYRETLRAVTRRALITAGLGRFYGEKPSGTLPNLWTREVTKDLLRPAGMVTRDLYGPKALAGVLERSRAGSAADTARVSRILTLELLGRLIAGR